MPKLTPDSLPNEPMAETAVIGSLLINSQADWCEWAYEHLAPSDFYQECNQMIFKAAQGLHRAGVPVDIVTLAATFSDNSEYQTVGGTAYLSDCVYRTPSPFVCEHYARIVKAKAEDRKKIEDGLALVAAGYEGRGGKKGFEGFDI